MILFLILFLGLSGSFVWTVYKETKRRKIISLRIEEIKRNYNKDSKILYLLLQSLAQEVSKQKGWSKEKYERALSKNQDTIDLIKIYIKEGREHRALYIIDLLKDFYIYG